MASAEIPSNDASNANPNLITRGAISAFEHLITDKPPVLESLIAQLPTESILALYHTSSHLQHFLKNSPTSWRHISWRLYQPALQVATPPNNGTGSPNRHQSNYALDQLLLYVINPFSTRLVSLELDNTAVSGATLFHTVMVSRRDTLEHVSVRGCKNVSLKYHINPCLMMHAIAMDQPEGSRAPGYKKLALKSLYTYRCRHHRRRPYLPSSLARKESDSEPTHELVLTCHKLGIYTDTAWCTTPGARCFRRRGYVTMRVPQDPREVWVVYDRLWRSRNWLGPVPESRSNSSLPTPRKRKPDCRSWEMEEAMNGEPLGTTGEGKVVPTHLRQTHREFVDDIYCDNCSDPILERCEQCSVMMHCSGCRKTLCASCAFDRPYLRNKLAPEEERNKFWWAPGCAVSPCSMQDQDNIPQGPGGNPGLTQTGSVLPNIKFKWCCTEPVFSGGGGITFGSGSSRETDRIRAAPLRSGQGWEDPEFSSHSHLHREAGHTDAFTQIGHSLSRDEARGPGGRWTSIDNLFVQDRNARIEEMPSSVPRILCNDCHSSEQWKIKCKACATALCLRHDVKDRLKVRICGYKDLNVEKTEFKARQKALKMLALLMLRRRMAVRWKAEEERIRRLKTTEILNHDEEVPLKEPEPSSPVEGEPQTSALVRPADDRRTDNFLISDQYTTLLDEQIDRPHSPGSNSTGPSSRASSVAASARSIPVTSESNNPPQRPERPSHPVWRGCQSFFCPSTRTPGDHRRRCIAMMRQCADCKVHVCDQCVTGLEPSCPCKGCRVSTGEQLITSDPSSDELLRFFCPNCRWARMKTGKCKRKLPARSWIQVKSKSKRKTKLRKPIAERRTPEQRHIIDSMDDIAEYFSRFQIEPDGATPDELESAAEVVAAQQYAIATEGNPEEIRQLEDMGVLARDLIRRIQTLRRQFGPESLAALALPHITVDDSPMSRSSLTGVVRQVVANIEPPGQAVSIQQDTGTEAVPNAVNGGQQDSVGGIGS